MSNPRDDFAKRFPLVNTGRGEPWYERIGHAAAVEEIYGQQEHVRAERRYTRFCAFWASIPTWHTMREREWWHDFALAWKHVAGAAAWDARSARRGAP